MKNLLYIGNKLSKHGYTPTCIEKLGPFLEGEGYRLQYASSKHNQLLRFLDMGFAVVKYRKKVDVVLIDSYSTFSFWYVVMVSQMCRLLQLKYIPILHGGNLPYRLDATPKLCQMVFNHSFKNVAPSGYLLDAFQKRGYRNLLFIPNTIDLADYPFLKERASSVPKLLWVRSFASLYNPKMAVDVLKAVQNQYPTATLCMVGPDKEGSLAATQLYAEQENVTVTFTGRLAKAEWVALSNAYNVFINTTHFDNTPYSVIEAMSLGLPVVSTNVGGLPFLLQDRSTALLVEDGDAKGMAKAIVELTADTVLKQTLIQNGRKYVESFDWEVVKQKWATLFQTNL